MDICFGGHLSSPHGQQVLCGKYSWTALFPHLVSLWGGRRVVVKGTWEGEDKCEGSEGKPVAKQISLRNENIWKLSVWKLIFLGKLLCIPRVTSNPVWGFSSSWLSPRRNTGLRWPDLQLFKRKKKSHLSDISFCLNVVNQFKRNKLHRPKKKVCGLNIISEVVCALCFCPSYHSK